MNSLSWVGSWLKVATMDYYGAAVPLSLIAILSEEGLVRGGLWALGFCLIGSPATLAYTAYRLYFKSLALAKMDPDFEAVSIKKKNDDAPGTTTTNDPISATTK
jgi:hypothetical protein